MHCFSANNQHVIPGPPDGGMPRARDDFHCHNSSDRERDTHAHGAEGHGLQLFDLALSHRRSKDLLFRVHFGELS